MHQRNAAKRAIGTFKDYFIEGLWYTDTKSPMQSCYGLLNQEEITIKLLHPSRLNPRLSAYAKLNCTFEFYKNTMEPPWTCTSVQDSPNKRGTWDPKWHGRWYLRTEILHYCCLAQYTPKTATHIIYDTTEFLPARPSPPRMSSEYVAMHVNEDLTHAILNSTTTIPLMVLGEKYTAPLKQK